MSTQLSKSGGKAAFIKLIMDKTKGSEELERNLGRMSEQALVELHSKIRREQTVNGLLSEAAMSLKDFASRFPSDGSENERSMNETLEKLINLAARDFSSNGAEVVEEVPQELNEIADRFRDSVTEIEKVEKIEKLEVSIPF